MAYCDHCMTGINDLGGICRACSGTGRRLWVRLGDRVWWLATALGFRHCRACDRRRHLLNAYPVRGSFFVLIALTGYVVGRILRGYDRWRDPTMVRQDGWSK